MKKDYAEIADTLIALHDKTSFLCKGQNEDP